MRADSLTGQGGIIERKARREENGGETLFGLVLALTTLYAIGSLIAFLVTWAAR